MYNTHQTLLVGNQMKRYLSLNSYFVGMHLWLLTSLKDTGKGAVTLALFPAILTFCVFFSLFHLHGVRLSSTF